MITSTHLPLACSLKLGRDKYKCSLDLVLKNGRVHVAAIFTLSIQVPFCSGPIPYHRGRREKHVLNSDFRQLAHVAGEA